jgi:hypothetical protein
VLLEVYAFRMRAITRAVIDAMLVSMKPKNHLVL